jgi:hypothetical protein
MIRFLPLFVGLAPIVGVVVAYWLNVEADKLPSCMPLIDGCTSISATGRYVPGSMVFRAVLLPQAPLLIFLWWVGVHWLRTIAPSARVHRAILICGVTGAIALILYVMFLGTKQPFYEFTRRFGIYFYFLGTALAQVIMARAMPQSLLRTAMLWVISIPFALGILNLLLKVLLDDSNNFENSIEWVSALLMQAWFVLLYFSWRGSDFAITVRTGSGYRM